MVKHPNRRGQWSHVINRYNITTRDTLSLPERSDTVSILLKPARAPRPGLMRTSGQAVSMQKAVAVQNDPAALDFPTLPSIYILPSHSWFFLQLNNL